MAHDKQEVLASWKSLSVERMQTCKLGVNGALEECEGVIRDCDIGS